MVKNSALGGLIGGFLSTPLSLALDSTWPLLAGVILAGAVSSLDKGFARTLLGILIFYFSSAFLFVIHTITTGSSAAFGILALAYLSPILIPSYLTAILALRRIRRRRSALNRAE